MAEQSHDPALHRPLWMGFLIVASVVFSLGFACAVPFAAFAATAALTLNRRQAFVLVGAIWLANQILGFAVRHYPLTTATFAWGAALGFVALLSTLAAQWAKDHLPQAHIAAAAVAFAAAFAVYEGSLLAISAALGSGLSDYAFSVVTRIFSINAAAFAVLALMYRLWAFARIAKEPLESGNPLPAGHASETAAPKAEIL
jgi:hypothetical protein